jgi:adenosylcobinamide kinase/adenosylcobinamide-phosphate guanylyltransferase
VDAMLSSPASIIAVSEQFGWDVVPMEASGRLFRDAIGRMVQRVAKDAESAYLVIAGYALDLRSCAAQIGCDLGR